VLKSRFFFSCSRYYAQKDLRGDIKFTNQDQTEKSVVEIKVIRRRCKPVALGRYKPWKRSVVRYLEVMPDANKGDFRPRITGCMAEG